MMGICWSPCFGGGGHTCQKYSIEEFLGTCSQSDNSKVGHLFGEKGGELEQGCPLHTALHTAGPSTERHHFLRFVPSTARVFNATKSKIGAAPFR